MSTPQERAKKYEDEWYKSHGPHSSEVRLAFIAGEKSGLAIGQRLEREQLSAKELVSYEKAMSKALEGFKEEFGASALASKVFEYSVPPLLATVAELEAAISLTNKVLLNAREEYRKELEAWQEIGDEYSKLIDHCTRGLLSKANLPAKTVISVMEERLLEPKIAELEAENKELKEFKAMYEGLCK